MVGSDPSLRLVIEMAGTIAPTRTPVLIVGERGTGKALLARAIHGLGSRPDQPFVTVDCAALTEATAERDRAGRPADPPTRPEPGFDWPSKLTRRRAGRSSSTTSAPCPTTSSSSSSGPSRSASASTPRGRTRRTPTSAS